MQPNWNYEWKVRNWAHEATEDVKDEALRNILREEARALVMTGSLRGDVSEFWIKKYPELRDQLKDLFL